MALDEVIGRDDVAAHAGEARRDVVDDGRERPQHVLRAAAGDAARQHEQGRRAVHRREAHDRPRRAPGRRAREQGEVDRDDDGVGDGERRPGAGEGARDRERHHEERAHATEQQEAPLTRSPRHGVRQPGVARYIHQITASISTTRTRPPASDPRRGRSWLRDREDEHEVEEQLERRDPELIGGVHVHRRIVVAAPGGERGQGGARRTPPGSRRAPGRPRRVARAVTSPSPGRVRPTVPRPRGTPQAARK